MVFQTEKYINKLSNYLTMKQLNVTFEDDEFEHLLKSKGEMDWRRFLLKLVNYKGDIK